MSDETPERRRATDDAAEALQLAITSAAQQQAAIARLLEQLALAVRFFRRGAVVVVLAVVVVATVVVLGVHYVTGATGDTNNRAKENRTVLLCEARSERAIASDIHAIVKYGRNITAAELPVPAECAIGK